MTSETTGPGVRKLREALIRGERPGGADLIREYPDEAIAITDEVRNASVRDSMARERTWLIRARVLGGAGEDVTLGTTVRGERTERGLTRKALTQAVRERGANLRPAVLAELEANRMASVEPAVWPALIAELELDPHEVVAGVRLALAAEGVPDPDVEAHLDPLRGELGLPTIPPLEEPVREEAVRDDEDAGVRAHRESLVARLTALFGEGAAWSGPDVEPATTWTPPAFDLLWRDGGRDIELRRVWVARKGSGARPVVLLAPADDESRLRVYGPQHPRPVRELPAERVFALLERAASLHFNEAASMLAREFIRLDSNPPIEA